MAQQLKKIKPGTTYIFQSGDTRKSIAMRAYDDPNQFGRIYDLNKTKLENLKRRRLTPGLKLDIPPKGGGEGGNDRKPDKPGS